MDEDCIIFEQASGRAEQYFVRVTSIFQAWGIFEEIDLGRPDIAATILEQGV